jgi:hypothetical protein
MKKTAFILGWLFTSRILYAQDASNCGEKISFSEYARCVIEDHSKDNKLLPKPPFLTDTVIAGMQHECALNDSARYYLDNFSFSKKKYTIKSEESLTYFFYHDCFYTLLALTVHWNPDTRVKATRELQQLIRVSMRRNDQKLKTGIREKEYNAAKAFLIYILENTPWTISGSENATIHDIYIQTILSCMYILYGERPPYNDMQVYIYTEEDIQNHISRWKEQLK